MPEVTVFNGISILPRKVAKDEEYRLRDNDERKVRIDRLTAAIGAYLRNVDDRIATPFYDSQILGDVDSAQSSVLCVPWAEAKYKDRPIYMSLNEEKQLGYWVPTTDHLAEAELKQNGSWAWIHVLYFCAETADSGVLVGV